MASRRLRIKPVANVPVRRGKVNSENVRTDEAGESGEKEDMTKLEQEGSDTLSMGGNSPNNNSLPCEDSEPNDIPHNVVIASSSQNIDCCLKNVNEVSSASQHGTDETVKSQESEVGKAEVDASESAACKSKSLVLCTTPLLDKIPLGPVRKRMKPAVSIPAVTRRPRMLCKVVSDDKLEIVSSLVNSNKNIQEGSVQQNIVTDENVSEGASIMLPCYQKGNNEVSLSGGKSIGLGVPGIAQIIPTGTAIRPQLDGNIGVSGQIYGNGEAPHSLPEPDLPSEEAGGGYSKVLLKPSSSQVNVVQRSRFIKPRPQILDPSVRKCKSVDGSASNRESDDASKPHSSDSFPFNNDSGKVVSRLDWQTPNLIDRIESLKPENASATESEDESRRCVSDTDDISPPARKSVETSRGRFVRQTPRFIEASMRRHSMQVNAVESEEELSKQTCLVTSPHKRHADTSSEEPAATPNDFGSFEEADKKVTRVRRTASSGMQRMARARQEFQNKFGNQAPDRSRLTMFDLIFYNPTTNPMKCSDQGNDSSRVSQNQSSDEHIIEEHLEEEQVDEPAVEGEDRQNDKNSVEEEEAEEDMAMPVPQVKVGPDGQIILDEKSLVIETTGAKKSREDLANSAVIVDYGTGYAGYGTYSKRNKKSKEWSKQETLKFYRALNTVGTDFLLMQSIFPKRTRQDLKMKFKKEDRMNRFLVEKALRYPLDFDLTELEKDLEKEEEEERHKKLAKLLKKRSSCKKIKKKISSSKRSVRKGFLSASMDPGDTGDRQNRNKRCKRRRDGGLNELSDEGTSREKQPCKAGRVNHERGESCSSLSDDDNELEFNYDDELKFSAENEPLDTNTKSDNDSEGSDNDTRELEYLSKPPKPTRSGRIPQPRKLDRLEDDVTLGNKGKRTLNRLVSANNILKPGAENQPLPLEDLTNVEPGSLVVLATQSPTNPSHHVYKVFMVPPNPANLSSVAPTMSPVPVSLPSALLQSMTVNVTSSQLCDESHPTDE